MVAQIFFDRRRARPGAVADGGETRIADLCRQFPILWRTAHALLRSLRALPVRSPREAAPHATSGWGGDMIQLFNFIEVHGLFYLTISVNCPVLEGPHGERTIPLRPGSRGNRPETLIFNVRTAS